MAISSLSFLLMIFALGASNIYVCGKLASVRVWPVTLYWSGWIAGIVAASLLSGDGSMPVFTEDTRTLLLRLHVAAACGFTTACFIFHVARLALRRDPATHRVSEASCRLLLDPRVVRLAFVIQVAFGLLLLYSRLREIGNVSPANVLAEIRLSYIRSAVRVETLPIMIRLASHLANCLALIPFFFGVQDGLDRKMRPRRVSAWWIAGIPWGLSTGGRGWIITVPILYLVAYAITANPRFRRESFRRWVTRFLPLAICLSLLFAAVEKGRRTNTALDDLTAHRIYEFTPFGKAIVYYLGLPILGVDAYTKYAEGERPYHGKLTFAFFGAQLHRLGLSDERTATSFDIASRSAVFFGPYPILFATHVPVVPNLVADFGIDAFPFVFAGLCLFTLLAYLCCLDGGIFARFLATTICVSWLWSFQTFQLADAGFVLPVAWLGVFLLFESLSRNVRSGDYPLIALRATAPANWKPMISP